MHWGFAFAGVSSLLSLCHGFVTVHTLRVPSAFPATKSAAKNGPTWLSMATTTKDSIMVSDPALEQAYHDSFAIIDACSVRGVPTEELYDAVRVIDKNAWKLYPTLDAKEALWHRAHGSWHLQLATGGGKFTTFKPIPKPLFAFAMIDETDFGNGVGLFDSDTILLALRGPHDFSPQRRQMVIGIDDMFLWKGNFRVTESLPGFMREGMGLGKRAEDYAGTNQRPPAFTMIGASEKSLIARGGTGGIAIWTRLDHDIRPLAYGDSK